MGIAASPFLNPTADTPKDVGHKLTNGALYKAKTQGRNRIASA
jgi:PleD family two-component response regulator